MNSGFYSNAPSSGPGGVSGSHISDQPSSPPAPGANQAIERSDALIMLVQLLARLAAQEFVTAPRRTSPTDIPIDTKEATNHAS
jgi:hypothetical protein